MYSKKRKSSRRKRRRTRRKRRKNSRRKRKRTRRKRRKNSRRKRRRTRRKRGGDCTSVFEYKPIKNLRTLSELSEQKKVWGKNKKKKPFYGDEFCNIYAQKYMDKKKCKYVYYKDKDSEEESCIKKPQRTLYEKTIGTTPHEIQEKIDRRKAMKEEIEKTIEQKKHNNPEHMFNNIGQRIDNEGYLINDWNERIDDEGYLIDIKEKVKDQEGKLKDITGKEKEEDKIIIIDHKKNKFFKRIDDNRIYHQDFSYIDMDGILYDYNFNKKNIKAFKNPNGKYIYKDVEGNNVYIPINGKLVIRRDAVSL